MIIAAKAHPRRDERSREEPRRRDAARAAKRGAQPRVRPSGASGGDADARRRGRLAALRASAHRLRAKFGEPQ